jgi:hypothetical protein
MTIGLRASRRRAAQLLATTAALTGLLAGTAAGATFYDNGGQANGPGQDPDGPGTSILNTAGGDSLLGFGASAASGVRVADDFTVSGPGGWKINGFQLFTYQTGSTTTSTITSVNVRIWDGPPDVTPADTGAVVVFGDTTTNRMTTSVFSGIYRVTDTAPADVTRPIMRVTVATPVTLPPGTYWVDYQFAGSLASGPWAPPVSAAPVAGNAVQLLGDVWGPALDNTVQRRLPFKVLGDPDTSVTASSVSATTATFTFTGSPASLTTGFECRLDAQAFSACPGGKQYTGLSEGSHTFEVRSLIGAAPDPTPATRTFTVDVTGPMLALTGKQKQKAGTKITGTAECSEACSVHVTGRLSARSGSGPKVKINLKAVQVTVTANGATKVTLALSKKARAAVRAALSSGGTATVKLTGQATDAAANQGKPARLRIRLT